MTGPGLPDGTRLQVRAGTATPEELAAVLLALDAAVAADAPPPRPPRSAWTAAARQEGVGGASVGARTALRGWGAAG